MDSTPPNTLYAIIDGAQFDDVGAVIQSLEHAQAASLFSGSKGRELGDVAPYLVWHPNTETLLAWFIGYAQHLPIGVLVVSAAPMSELRRHLAEQLIVAFEDGTHALFRYYDPRVFVSAVDTLTADQLLELAGPIRVALAMSPDGTSLVAHILDEAGVVEFPVEVSSLGSDPEAVATKLLARHASFFAAYASH